MITKFSYNIYTWQKLRKVLEDLAMHFHFVSYKSLDSKEKDVWLYD